MKACPRCGAKHIDSAVVCLKCGAVMGNVPGGGQVQGAAGTNQQARGNEAAQSAAGNSAGRQSAQPSFRHVSNQPTYSAADLGKMQQRQTNGQYGAGASQANSPYGNRAAHMNNQYGGGTSQTNNQYGAGAAQTNNQHGSGTSQCAPGAFGKGPRTAQKKQHHTSAIGPGPKERRGRRAFLIGMIVMGIYTLINAVFMLLDPSYPYGIGYMIGYWLVSAFVGGAYGFGFAFGMDYVKRWTKAGAWSAGKIGLWAWFLKVLRGEEHISLLTFPLIAISLAVGVGFGWIPGIPKGIREIRKERRQRSQGSI